MIHGNYLDDREIEFLARHARRMAVVYCPRTHAWFDRPPYPLEKMLAAGAEGGPGRRTAGLQSPDLTHAGRDAGGSGTGALPLRPRWCYS